VLRPVNGYDSVFMAYLPDEALGWIIALVIFSAALLPIVARCHNPYGSPWNIHSALNHAKKRPTEKAFQGNMGIIAGASEGFYRDAKP
jgi:hypothetical protein